MSAGSLIVPFDTGNGATVKSAVNGLGASGGTPTTTALIAAIDEIGDYVTSGEKRIVLLTDGQNSCAPPTLCKVVEDAVSNGVQFSLYTVGLGSLSTAQKTI